MKTEKKKRSTLSWIMEFAGMNKSAYLGSVIMAVISVAAGFVPCVFVADIVRALIDGENDMAFYLTQCGYIAICWLINKAFHTCSTTLSLLIFQFHDAEGDDTRGSQEVESRRGACDCGDRICSGHCGGEEFQSD